LDFEHTRIAVQVRAIAGKSMNKCFLLPAQTAHF
jgi:hypothetical protein